MILMRHCLRDGSILNDRCFRPAHRSWHIIKILVRPGAAISPLYAISNINRITKAVFAKLAIIDSDRYTSKCFRLGPPDAKDSDSTIGQIMREAGWGASDYRLYLLLQQDEGVHLIIDSHSRHTWF